MGFVNLHNHSEYSKLDGIATVPGYIKRAIELGQNAIGLTDHGTLAGTYELVTKCVKEGINPIVGIEAYVAPDVHRTSKERFDWASGSGTYGHITLFAQNNTGMQNLFRMQKLAYTEGFYMKPRIDMELLSQFNEGVIATTGCPSGIVSSYLRNDNYAAALTYASEMKDIFQERLYVEMMDHGLDIEREVRDALLGISATLKLPLLATNDCHYVHDSDTLTHERFLCISTGTNMSDHNRFRFSGSGYYLKSEDEMLATGLPSEAVQNTQLLADMCSVGIVSAVGSHMPVWDGGDAREALLPSVMAGLARKMGTVTPEYEDRVRHEVGIILAKGYADYFMTVAEIVNWGKSAGIKFGPARGSGGGSLCAYGLGITDMDPIPYGCQFERFLNPERDSLPDFDIDVEVSRRNELKDHILERYGFDFVADIGTEGRFKALQSLIDAGKVLEVGGLEKVSSAIPDPVHGKPMALADCFNEDHPRYKEAAKVRKLAARTELADGVSFAMELEGLLRNTGSHAAGVVISTGQPLTDLLPVRYDRDANRLVTEWTMGPVEDIGLVKKDFLGLKNLDIIKAAVASINKRHGLGLELESLYKDTSDPAVYEMLSRGDNVGVFQLSGGGMSDLLRRMRPTCFADICAANALYRPGPMGVGAHLAYADRKNGREAVTPLHPELGTVLDDILGDTYGLIVYQEQVMAIAQRLGGYTLGGADILRRIMGKKKEELLAPEEPKFKEHMLSLGYSEDAFRTVWATLIPFADYAFNKPHAVGYMLLGYATAWLKTYYPADLLAAAINVAVVNKDIDGKKEALADCRQAGVSIIPPVWNVSGLEYSVVDDKHIAVGLDSIRGCATNDIEAIVEQERSLRALLSTVNKKTLDGMILAGCFDTLGVQRNDLFKLSTQISNSTAPDLPIHDILEPLKTEPTLQDKLEIVAHELQYLGSSVSIAPMSLYEASVAASGAQPLSECTGKGFYVVGALRAIVQKKTKTGKTMYILTLDDGVDAVEGTTFELPEGVVLGSVLTARGSVNMWNGRASVRFSEIELLEPSDAEPGTVMVRIPAEDLTGKLLADVFNVCRKSPGHTQVKLLLTGGADDWYDLEKITPDEQTLKALARLVGKTNVREAQ